MKTKKSPSPIREKLTVSLTSWGDYHDEIHRLERLLGKKPASIEIELIGIGEMSPDIALIFRSVLMARPRRTRIITHARSSLKDSAVLLWLLGDRRMIREDAHFLITAAGPFEDPEAAPAVWKGPQDDSETDVDGVDYVRVLHRINEFLPVRELAGQLFGEDTLRQFGLVDHEKADELLRTFFAKSRPTSRPGASAKKEKKPGSADRGSAPSEGPPGSRAGSERL